MRAEERTVRVGNLAVEERQPCAGLVEHKRVAFEHKRRASEESCEPAVLLHEEWIARHFRRRERIDHEVITVDRVRAAHRVTSGACADLAVPEPETQLGPGDEYPAVHLGRQERPAVESGRAIGGTRGGGGAWGCGGAATARADQKGRGQHDDDCGSVLHGPKTLAPRVGSLTSPAGLMTRTAAQNVVP